MLTISFHALAQYSFAFYIFTRMNPVDKIVRVLLPLPLRQLFTYSVGAEAAKAIMPGCRVLVQFGKKKIYTALVIEITSVVETEFELKPVLEIIDKVPIVNAYQLRFWKWMASYYMCSVGEVYKASLPTGLKLDSETNLMINPDAEAQQLSKNETLIYDLVDTNSKISISDLARSMGNLNIHTVVRKLVNKQILTTEEYVKDGFKPKLEKMVSLHANLNHEFKINAVLDDLARAPKQFQLLASYLELSGFTKTKTSTAVVQKQLLEQSRASSAALNALVKKEVFVVSSRETQRLNQDWDGNTEFKQLSVEQNTAYNEIKNQFAKFDSVLLHGVTSSGKTEIYIQLIKETIEEGKQVLYLLPEIALTTQLIQRLKKAFGNKIGVYHSKFSDNERVETYNALNKDPDKYPVIIGVRSSVFLPFSKLGLIIVDEEHENTYKQYDPAPRYNARDSSVVLAQMHGAKVLLGTATPSLETYHNVKTNKYGLVELFTRYSNIQLPEIKVVDMNRVYRKKEQTGNFSPLLYNSIANALKQNEQVILFQNRRGFSPYIQCNTCGWIPYCKQCDVSMTYHKHFGKLNCHYCGSMQYMPKECDNCASTDLSTKGFGTEKIEDDIKLLFPHAKTARLDLDTARTRKKYESIIHDFETGNTNILIGTQMVSKGLDFDNVSVVGIVNADNMLSIPDFRAWERAFQLMAQVSGRAGRKKKQGLVIVQTRDFGNPVIQQVIDNNYKGLFLEQAAERKLFRYPPYYRLIRISMKHRDKQILSQAAKIYGQQIRKKLGARVLGPEYPLVPRIQNQYIKQILIKLEREVSVQKLKEYLLEEIDIIKQSPDFKQVVFVPDVDPM
jgi:primosomal protein N' (replication factor Y)